MNWFFLALISVFSLAISSILQRLLMKDKESDPFAYAIVFQLLCSFLIGSIALMRGFVFPPITQIPLNFLIMTVFFGLATILSFKAFKTIQASEMVILGSTSAIWTAAAASLFLKEPIGINKVIGILLILGGIVMVFFKNSSFKFNKGFIWALLSAFFFGVSLTNDAYILRYAEVFSYNAVGFLLPGLFLLVLNPKSINEIKKLAYSSQSVLKKMVILSFFYSFSAVAVCLAYQQGGNISQLGPIIKSSVILTVLLSVLFLGERDNLLKKSFAAVMTVIGVIIIK